MRRALLGPPVALGVGRACSRCVLPVRASMRGDARRPTASSPAGRRLVPRRLRTEPSSRDATRPPARDREHHEADDRDRHARARSTRPTSSRVEPAGGAASASRRSTSARASSLTVGELLRAMLVRSANDAAEALALYVGHGSEESFRRAHERRRPPSSASPTRRSRTRTGSTRQVTSRALAMRRCSLRYALGIPFIRDTLQRSVGLDARGAVTSPTTDDLLESWPPLVAGKTGHTARCRLVGGRRREPATGATVYGSVLGSRIRGERNDALAALLSYGLAAVPARRSSIDRSRVYADGEDGVRAAGGAARRAAHAIATVRSRRAARRADRRSRRRVALPVPTGRRARPGRGVRGQPARRVVEPRRRAEASPSRAFSAKSRWYARRTARNVWGMLHVIVTVTVNAALDRTLTVPGLPDRVPAPLERGAHARRREGASTSPARSSASRSRSSRPGSPAGEPGRGSSRSSPPRRSSTTSCASRPSRGPRPRSSTRPRGTYTEINEWGPGGDRGRARDAHGEAPLPLAAARTSSSSRARSRARCRPRSTRTPCAISRGATSASCSTARASRCARRRGGAVPRLAEPARGRAARRPGARGRRRLPHGARRDRRDGAAQRPHHARERLLRAAAARPEDAAVPRLRAARRARLGRRLGRRPRSRSSSQGSSRSVHSTTRCGSPSRPARPPCSSSAPAASTRTFAATLAADVELAELQPARS